MQETRFQRSAYRVIRTWGLRLRLGMRRAGGFQPDRIASLSERALARISHAPLVWPHRLLIADGRTTVAQARSSRGKIPLCAHTPQPGGLSPHPAYNRLPVRNAG